MPWKNTSDPYHIWISEIILQQTRVAQGLKYYTRFLARFPDVAALAEATEDEVLSIWKGLGYYSRARNLHTAAKTIVTDYNGQFPNQYEDILSLKGIGPYSAAAISSFAFNLPYAALDGNVFRVLSRYFGIDTAIDTTTGKKLFTKYAQDTLADHPPAQYNQALMDLGALICTPQNSNCPQCPLSKKCQARLKNQVYDLPVKSKKLKIKIRYFRYIVIINEDKILLHRRGSGDIWTGLYEPPMIETKASISKKELANQFTRLLGQNIMASVLKTTTTESQKLTHQTIHVTFYHLHQEVWDSNFIWKNIEDLDQTAMPKVVDTYLKSYLGEGGQSTLF